MKLQLEEYQKDLVRYLTSRHNAYCCVGLGLGKTASTLSALNELFADGAINSALVVAPLRVARMTWPNEVAKWDDFAWMKTEHIRGTKPSGKSHLYFINYERLDELKTLKPFDVLIFDEVTRAKNHASKRIARLMPKIEPGHIRWGLTGTPRPNSLMELFGQLRLIDSGERLGRSFARFRSRWFYPVDYMEYDWQPRPGAPDEIYRTIADITFTLRTSDHLKLPDIYMEDLHTPIRDAALATYKRLEKDMLAMINNREITAVNAAVLVNKLLQVCGGAVYNAEGGYEVVHDRKIAMLKKVVQDFRDEPVLVAANYVHEVERIVKEIPGAVAASTLGDDLETRWNNREIPVLVAHPASLGHGLNLQGGGRVVVWYSLTWSRELYDQFNGRVIRKGQTKAPEIYRIVVPGTIDDVVIETLKQRGDEQSIMTQIMLNYQKMKEAL
jgi:superfamily II DNA or RNA helicase